MTVAATAIALFVVAASVAAVVASTSAAFAAQVVDHLLNLLVGGVALFQNGTRELQLLSGQRVVGVDGHMIIGYFDDASHEAALVGIHHGDDGSFEDVFSVEVAVDGKHIAAHLVYALWVVFSKTFFSSQFEVEFGAGFQVGEILFKSIERHAKSADKLERASLLGLFFKVLVAILIEGVELIARGDVLVLWFVHKIIKF